MCIRDSNKGGTKFTAAEEYEFVTNPDLSKTYGNGRKGTQLDVFLLAADAQRRDSTETTASGLICR